MKRISFSKSVRTIGLMAMLSVTIATSLQQPIQAQSKGNRIPTTEDGTCKPLPQGTNYQEFGGIKFSSKQKSAYRKSIAKMGERFKPINDAIPLADSPNEGNLSFESVGKLNEQKFAEANAAYTALLFAQVPGNKIIEYMKIVHGKYAKVSRMKTPSREFTQKEIAEGQQIGLDFEAEMMSVFTPEQQKIYQANLAIQRQIQACTPPNPYGKIISPLPF
jgi:hypothetical protein